MNACDGCGWKEADYPRSRFKMTEARRAVLLDVELPGVLPGQWVRLCDGCRESITMRVEGHPDA